MKGKGAAVWAWMLGRGRSGAGTGRGTSQLGAWWEVGGETYWDGVDVEDGDLGREVGQVSAGKGFVECTFDEVRKVGRGLYAHHVGICGRHC